MRRIGLVALVAVVATGAWWLAEDGNLRRQLIEAGQHVIDRARGKPPPSWGDVAAKVGEFAAEERDLKKTVGDGQIAPRTPVPDAPPNP